MGPSVQWASGVKVKGSSVGAGVVRAGSMGTGVGGVGGGISGEGVGCPGDGGGTAEVCDLTSQGDLHKHHKKAKEDQKSC